MAPRIASGDEMNVRPRRGRADGGFTILGLLVTVAIVNIALGVAVTSWVTRSKRAKETELIWRGQQYQRALACHQREVGGLPDQLDELLDSGCIRAIYPDPMSTDGQWRVLRRSDLAELGATGPGMVSAAGSRAFETAMMQEIDREMRGPAAFLDRGSRDLRGRRLPTQLGGGGGLQSIFGAAGQPQGQQGGGGRGGGLQQAFSRLQSSSRGQRTRIGGGDSIVGVISRSPDEGLRLFAGESLYSEWRFIVQGVGG